MKDGNTTVDGQGLRPLRMNSVFRHIMPLPVALPRFYWFNLSLKSLVKFPDLIDLGKESKGDAEAQSLMPTFS